METSFHSNDPLLERVTTFLAHQQLLPQHGRVIVALSGGADSLCLLHILHQLCGPGKRYPALVLQAAHLDHQLRAGSADEATHVAHLARAWGLPITIEHCDVASLAQRDHHSLEEAARIARYAFLRRVAQGDLIAVAHHQDDQVETLLLHLLRGGGLASIVGLQPRQQDIIRPLLCATHTDTLAYCARHQLVPIEDESNTDPHFLRNRIRHELVPLLTSLNSGIQETLLRNAQVMSVDLAWTEEQVAAAWPLVVLDENDQRISLHVPRLRTLAPSIQRHLLRHVTAHICDGQSPLELRHYQLIEELLQRTQQRHTITLHMPHNLAVDLVDDILVLKRINGHRVSRIQYVTEDAGISLPVPGRVQVPGTSWLAHADVMPDSLCVQVRQALLHEDWPAVWQLLPRSNAVAYIDADILKTQDIFVRTRRPGDRIQLLGMAHEKKVKDVLIDEHIPHALRQHIPLFFSSDHCLWIAGVRLDERARLHLDTRRIIRLAITTDDM